MKTKDELKQEAQTWRVAHIICSFMQICFFSSWVFVVLAVINAPVWAYVFGAFYVIGNWAHYFTVAIANHSLQRWRESMEEK